MIVVETNSALSKNTSDENENESPKHKEVKPKSFTQSEKIYCDTSEEIEKMKAPDKNEKPLKLKVPATKVSPHYGTSVEEHQQKKSIGMKPRVRESELQSIASRGKHQTSHCQVKEKSTAESSSDESQTNSDNEESDSGSDSSESKEDSEGKSSYEEEKIESSTAPSEEEMKKKYKVTTLYHEKESEQKNGIKGHRKKKASKTTVDQSRYVSPGSGRIKETCTKKVKEKGVGEAAAIRYASPKCDKQSNSEEHDSQRKRCNEKKQRRESSINPTAFGSSSPSTSPEKKSEKQGHRKKHVRKMKEKRERMKRGKEKTAHSSDTDDSSPECDMVKNQYEGEMKELVNIFEQFFGQLCCTQFDPKDLAAKLQKKGLISKSTMRDMVLSPESQQAKIIALLDELDEMIKSRPDCMFVIMKVMLKIDALQETAREILKEAGIIFLHVDCTLCLGSKITVLCR